MHKGELALRGVWLLWCCFMLALNLDEAWIVWHTPWLYPFGNSGPVAGLWYYASPGAYGTKLLLMTVWYSAGAFLCFRKGVPARVLLVLHAGVSVLLVLAMRAAVIY